MAADVAVDMAPVAAADWAAAINPPAAMLATPPPFAMAADDISVAAVEPERIPVAVNPTALRNDKAVMVVAVIIIVTVDLSLLFLQSTVFLNESLFYVVSSTVFRK